MWQPLGFTKAVECEGYVDLKSRAEDTGNLELLVTIADFERAAKHLSEEERAVVCLKAWAFETEAIARLLKKSEMWVTRKLKKALMEMREFLNE